MCQQDATAAVHMGLGGEELNLILWNIMGPVVGGEG